MLSLHKLIKDYGNQRALNEFTYDFKKGIYAILGPNGSGKSTLMNIMTGNLTATAGMVLYNGKKVKNGSEYYRHVGYMPQYPGLYPDFSAYEMLDYISGLKGVRQPAQQIDELLAVFELTDAARKKVRALSGGMKQRLSIIQAFLGSPEIVILDEPTAGLDPRQRVIAKNFFSEAGKHMTILISTHIVSDVESIATECIFLKKGDMIASGNNTELIQPLADRCWAIDADIAGDEIRQRFGNRCRVDSSTGKERLILVSDKQPDAAAIPACPTLEDCYLYHFGEDGAHHENTGV